MIQIKAPGVVSAIVEPHLQRGSAMTDHSRQALVGAIGGTYISLAIADIDELTIANFALLNSADFEQPMQAVERYLASVPRCPNKVGLALAATVNGDKAAFIHRPWTLTRNDVRAATGADHVTLVNDFEALALALPHLTSYDLQGIHTGETVPHGTKVVIGAGTGLGVATLVHTGEDWLPISGEGGYAAFPAQPPGEYDIRQAFPPDSHISADDVFSGRGLVALYTALAKSRGGTATPVGARSIAAAGIAHEDPVAVEALDLMATWLGRFAGDIALIYGARGGVYLAGGLAANIVAVLSTGRFGDAFEAKGKRSAYLEAIPVKVVKTGADAGLRGAALALARILPPTRATPVRRMASSPS
jgi:glucokinase